MDFMQEAINIAKSSGKDLPIGAVLVKNGKIIAKAHNEKELKKDVTYHAEMLVIQEGQKVLNTTVLTDCQLYVTLEPCPMCAWAILNSRISKVFFGAYDTIYGALGSATDLRKYLNSKTEIIGGIKEEECSTLLKNYFKTIR